METVDIIAPLIIFMCFKQCPICYYCWEDYNDCSFKNHSRLEICFNCEKEKEQTVIPKQIIERNYLEILFSIELALIENNKLLKEILDNWEKTSRPRVKKSNKSKTHEPNEKI